MKSSMRKWVYKHIAPAVLALALLSVVVFSSFASEPPAEKLFETPTTAHLPAAEEGKYITRSRLVTVNAAPIATDRPAKSIALNLFPGVEYTAVLDQAKQNINGSRSWIGHIKGIPYSQVSFVYNQGILVGAVAMPQGIYELRYLADGIHAIYEINQAGFGPDHPNGAGPVPVPQLNDFDIDTYAPTDDGSVIDVMVLYSLDAVAGAGGAAAMQNTVLLSIDWTNTTYANSGIIQRLNLVHMAGVPYNDSGDALIDLYRLQSSNDGYIDAVHSWRNTYGADIVILIIEDPLCGIAFFMDPVSPAFHNYAFGVVGRVCSVSNYTFGHEAGHMMSARHDWFVDPDDTPFVYNHGHVHPGGQWRTVMAYANACGACPRLGYWSNPNILYNGAPMGVPQGQPLAADNHRVLNDTAFTVANFRQSNNTPPPPVGEWYLFLPQMLK